MASAGYYSCSSKSQSFSSQSSCRREETMVVPRPWPMSSPIQTQNSVGVFGTVVRRKTPASERSHEKSPRPMSMPSHHLRAHANALATLDSYGLDLEEPFPAPSLCQTPSSINPLQIKRPLQGNPTPTPSCVPWISNVKTIKKIQRKIGMGTGSEGKAVEESLRPLRFHSVHGDNIHAFQGGSAVRRVPSLTHTYCKAIVFSDRPVSMNERVCVRVIGTSTEFAGGIRFGFTNQDPNTLRYSLPDRAIPELAKRQGFWAKALLGDNLLKNEAILFYYINQSGKVRYGINGKKVGTFLKYVDTRRPLWALLDVYGNTTAIELVDPKAHLNNSRKSLELEESTKTNDDVDSALGQSLSGLNLRSDLSIVPTKVGPRFEPGFNNLEFHFMCGKNVQVNKRRNVAWRNSTESGNAYIFTSRPLQIGETIVVQIQKSDETYSGSLAFGFTSANPDSINPKTLPDDSYYLVDRSEYWIFKKDVIENSIVGDELAFTLTSTGAVNYSRNGAPSSVLMYIDTTSQLYAFFDLYGSTYKLSLLGSILSTPARFQQPEAFCRLISSPNLKNPTPTGPATSLNFPSSPFRGSFKMSPQAGCKNRVHDFRNGRSLSASPTKARISLKQDQPHPQFDLKHQISDLILSGHTEKAKLKIETPTSNSLICQRKEGERGMEGKKHWSVDCVACCKRPVNSLFSPCGHLTMCYECAWEFCSRHEDTSCPICNKGILDVIRITKS